MLTKATGAEELSDYEKVRARNIERNNAQLRALGLISAEEEAASNALAWERELPSVGSGTTKKTKNSAASAAAKKRKRQFDNHEVDGDHDGTSTSARNTTTSHKSLRLQGKQPDGIDIPVPSTDEDTVQQRRQARVQECREVRMRRALEVSEAGASKAAKENPTATYGHCLMRVQTMTEKGLANRIKVIERAAGKHSVVKMAIFKSCLQDEDMWELAELAGKALERLKALKPPPEG